jgi:MFS family permease
MTTSSRVRSRVLGFAVALAVITYLDRICISAAAPFIMDELHITVVQMSLVFGAFTLAYSIFEVPTGWMGDVWGARRVLTRIVAWWSAFTMLTGVARGLPSSSQSGSSCAGEAGAFQTSRAVSPGGSASRTRAGHWDDVLPALRRHAGGSADAVLIRQWGGGIRDGRHRRSRLGGGGMRGTRPACGPSGVSDQGAS